MDMIDKIWRKKNRLRLLDYDGLSKGTISECFNKICILCYGPCYIIFFFFFDMSAQEGGGGFELMTSTWSYPIKLLLGDAILDSKTIV